MTLIVHGPSSLDRAQPFGPRPTVVLLALAALRETPVRALTQLSVASLHAELRVATKTDLDRGFGADLAMRLRDAVIHACGELAEDGFRAAGSSS